MRQLNVDKLSVKIYPTREEMGKDAAIQAAQVIQKTIVQKGSARVVFASAPSQQDFLYELSMLEDIEWSKVEAYNQDEYIGATLEDDFSFGKYLKDRLYNKVQPGKIRYIHGDAKNLEDEYREFAEELFSDEIDLFIVGIGENCHIAFNEPHEANFNDKKLIKTITLDDVCKEQQKNDFGFKTNDDIPIGGITITIPGIMKAKHIICLTPSERKAEAIKNTLSQDISEKYPSTIIRTHPDATLYLDDASAKLI